MSPRCDGRARDPVAGHADAAVVKRRWRAALRRRWRELAAEDLARMASAAADRLVALPEWRAASTIFCFIAAEGELPTKSLVEAAWEQGKEVAAPYLPPAGNGPVMYAQLFTNWSQLRPGRFGILAPDPACTERLQPYAIDLAVVPGLAFDRSCRRLGQGGGYYDRFLPGLRLSAVRVGWTASQFMFESLPVEAHDQPVDLVVMDTGVHRCTL